MLPCLLKSLGLGQNTRFYKQVLPILKLATGNVNWYKPKLHFEAVNSVCLKACHLDPMLDDSIMMARRLRSLGREVYVELLDDLPHGFLNFVLLSHEAKRGSDVIVHCIRQILKLDEIDWNQFDVITDSDVEESGAATQGNVTGNSVKLGQHGQVEQSDTLS